MRWVYSVVASRDARDGGVEIGNVFGVTTAASEDEAYGKLRRKAEQKYPRSEGWEGMSVDLFRLDETRGTAE